MARTAAELAAAGGINWKRRARKLPPQNTDVVPGGSVTILAQLPLHM